jgi:hypothetical protein
MSDIDDSIFAGMADFAYLGRPLAVKVNTSLSVKADHTITLIAENGLQFINGVVR